MSASFRINEILFKIVSVLALLFGAYSATCEPWREGAFGISGGYSNFSGAVVAAKGTFSANLTNQIQWETGGLLTLISIHRQSGGGIFTGPILNLSEEQKTSTFLGGGLGYATQFPFGSMTDSDSQAPALFSYAKVGQRFSVGKSGNFSYRPSVTWFYNGRMSAVEIAVLEFSVFF